MTESLQPPSSTAAPADETSLSPIARAVAVFVNPAGAWSGLRARPQWWFPFLLVLVFNAAWGALLYPRAILPMVLDSVEAQVADGQVPAAQLEATERMMTSTTGIVVSIVAQGVTLAVMLLIVAAIVLFAVGFVLGARFSYRLALEVVGWAWLVKIPEYLVVGALAWSKQTMVGVHAGFGALLPEPETPSRLVTGAGHFLDALGPLAVWPVIVGVLGAAALSGAPRRTVAWVLLSLYAVLSVLGAALTTLSTPGA